jgi:predicted nucleic acid-binding protein
VILVDTNVLIDILSPGQLWGEWSLSQLATAGRATDFRVDPIIVAELASNFADLPSLYRMLARFDISVAPLDDESAFVAGARFHGYRRRQQGRTAILSDFLIGAHALQLDATLLTRDAGIYRTYFPELTLITPEDEHD